MLIGELIFNTSLFKSDIQQVVDDLKKLGYIVKETDEWNAYEIYKDEEE